MIRLEGVATSTGLDEVFTVPAGYRCAGALLVTYDLSESTLLRRVLAPLAGVDPAQTLQVYAYAPPVTVLCQRPWPEPLRLQGRIEILPFQPTGGRILHVKAGLLRLDPDDGRRSPLLRAYLGSANLTEGGFGTNREVVVWSQVRRSRGDDLVTAVMAVCREVADQHQTAAQLRAVLDGLLDGFPEPRMLPSSLRTTVADRQPLLRDVPHPEGFDRLDVITPPFWREGSAERLSEALTPLLPPVGGRVRLLTSTPALIVDGDDDPASAPVPPGLVRHLEDAGREVEIGVISEQDQHRSRPLHAKLYLLHGSTRSTVVLGSANATAPGLTGGNREAMVLLDLPREQAEQLVEQPGPWHTAVVDHAALPTGSVTDDPDVTTTAIRAVFVPDEHAQGRPGQARFDGSLHLLGVPAGEDVHIWLDGTDATAESDDDGRVDVADAFGGQTIRLSLASARLEVAVGEGDRVRIPIYLEAPEGFFDRQLANEEDPTRAASDRHPLEHLLLADLRRLRALPGRPTGGPRPVVGVDDRLALPIYHRLQTILRFRSSLRGRVDDGELAEYLDVQPDDARLHVARAAVHDASEELHHDELIRRLHAALEVTQGQERRP